MNNKANRVARLTSSNASLFMVNGNGENGFGAGALTYIDNKKKELEYGRGITLPVYKDDILWGKLWEVWVHWQLGTEYELIIDQTTIHPKYSFWSGSQDFNIKIEGKGISELKSYQMSNHFDYVRCLQQKSIEIFRKKYAVEYWQIVSNCCINSAKYGEAISFLPTEENLIEMRDMLENSDYVEKHLKDDPNKYKRFWDKDLYDLAFIPKHSSFPSMEKFRFEVPIEDKIALTGRMIKAGKLLLS